MLSKGTGVDSEVCSEENVDAELEQILLHISIAPLQR